MENPQAAPAVAKHHTDINITKVPELVKVVLSQQKLLHL